MTMNVILTIIKRGLKILGVSTTVIKIGPASKEVDPITLRLTIQNV